MKRYYIAENVVECADGTWIRYTDHCEAMKRIAGEGGQAEYCWVCNGAGSVSTGVDEASTTICRTCEGTGYRAAPAPSASPECTCPSGNGSLRHPCPVHQCASPWESINPAATLVDRLSELPEINFSNYTQEDVEALQEWALEAYALLAATPTEKKNS